MPGRMPLPSELWSGGGGLVVLHSNDTELQRCWGLKVVGRWQLFRVCHGGGRQPMCDPEGCSTVWGAVGGGGGPPPPLG